MNSENLENAKLVILCARLERFFIILFVIDTLIKILFHINGYKYLKDTSMLQNSEK